MFRYIMEDDEYVLVDEADLAHWRGPEIAVGFSYNPEEERGISGTLHKHGSLESVNAWAENSRRRYIAAGYVDMANEIVVVGGKIPFEDLDKMMNNSGYVGAWYKRLMDPAPCKRGEVTLRKEVDHG